MEDKPALAVDFDDVVAGFNRAWSAYHNEHYGTSVAYEGIYTFDMLQLYGVDMTTLAVRAWHFFYHHHESIELVPGTKAALHQLAGSFDLHLVTSRCEGTYSQTEQFLIRHALRNHFKGLHFTNGFVTRFPDRKRSKLAVMETINAQCIIDDAPENAITLANAGKKVLLPDRPWNQEVPEHPNIGRFMHWDEVPLILAA